jgi:hypothetical protein
VFCDAYDIVIKRLLYNNRSSNQGVFLDALIRKTRERGKVVMPSVFRHLALLTYSVCAVGASDEVRLEDGVDITYPIHHQLKDKSSIFSVRYEATMAGCHEKFSKHECDFTERTRLQMNLDQPSSQHNYTTMGFKKTKVPLDIWEDIQEFYTKNREEEHPEILPRGNTYVNSWESITQMVNIDDPVKDRPDLQCDCCRIFFFFTKRLYFLLLAALCNRILEVDWNSRREYSTA